MLELLRGLHLLQIQLTVQAETQGEIRFPRLLKHQHRVGKNEVNESICPSNVSNEQILHAVQRGHAKAKEMIEQLGMADLFNKHALWGSQVKIIGINGGAESCITPDIDDDSDEDENESEDKDNQKQEKDSSDILLTQEDCSANDVQHIAQDLDSIVKCNLVDPPIGKKTSKSFTSHYSDVYHPQPYIPLYGRREQESKKI